MKTRFLLITVLIASQFSNYRAFGETGWKKIENKFFSFTVPESFKKKDVQGIDSFVEHYASEGIELGFDYGMYSNNFEEWPKDTKYEIIKVDGKKARIGTMKGTDKDHPYLTQIHVEGTGLTMDAFCKSEHEVKLARKIFKSIVFKKIKS